MKHAIPGDEGEVSAFATTSAGSDVGARRPAYSDGGPLLIPAGAPTTLCEALVRAAKREGLPITCDVAVHHLHLIDVDIGFFDSLCRVTPKT